MLYSFNLNYQTIWGQQIFVCGNIEELGNLNESNAIPLQYLNNSIWNLNIEVKPEYKVLDYYYFIINQDGTKLYSALNYSIQNDFNKKNHIYTYDKWVGTENPITTFLTKPFQEIFFKKSYAKIKKNIAGYTHIFKIKAPQLNENETVCIIGNNDLLGNWDTEKAGLLQLKDHYYQIELKLPTEINQMIYKYGIYNTKTNSFVQFESGENRTIIFEQKTNERFIITDGVINLPIINWKGAGVAIPVFSLRSKNSFGVGEFTDIKLLANWCKKVNIKVIQLLPINDTIVTKTNADSYPYAANSSFALHPLYINLKEIGTLPADHKLQKVFVSKQRKLNKLTELDYKNVIKFKLQYLKELYLLDKSVLESEPFLQFFENNKHWLTAFAAYSFLRDKNKTIDFNKWGNYATIDAKKLEKLTSPKSAQYKDIAFWYFVQYHLHIQLSKAVSYSHQLGIALKGDLPIGIGRTSCDAWQHPELFNMDMQAGAPPDDFAVKGQNWGFPTYNWDAMQKDGFQWWKKRFEKMSDYFDAFRIDHILGFFRIWSIPLQAVEGIMGHFIPSIAIHSNEFKEKGIYFNYEKFCIPNFTEEYLKSIFQDRYELIRTHFFNHNEKVITLNKELSTQKSIDNYIAETNLFTEEDKINLFNCVSNVLFFEEENSDNTKFHFNFTMEKTFTFSQLHFDIQQQLNALYINYFYERQDGFWKIEANKKLPTLQKTTNMLICGEDLGMVPHCVPDVMHQLSVLSLEVQRMPKASNSNFVNLNEVPYLSVATPSTHDMSTIRGWWEENNATTQSYYNETLRHYGEAPQFCEPWIAKEIIHQHLHSPSMLSIFQLQDLMAINDKIRRIHPEEERINVPANPNHYWCYRMHLKLEDLIKETDFNNDLQQLIIESGRK